VCFGEGILALFSETLYQISLYLFVIVAVCCGVLRCVAVCCGVCCSVCCSVLQTGSGSCTIRRNSIPNIPATEMIRCGVLQSSAV